MSDTYLDDLLDQLVTVEPRPAWNDVLARTRRSRRRYGAMAVAVALLILAPTAWAVDGGFFGSPAPAPIQSEAAFMNEQAPQAVANAAAQNWPDPEQYGTTADLSKLRGLIQVQTADGPLDAWAAPSSNGGLCFFIDLESDLAPGIHSGAIRGAAAGYTQPGGLAKNAGTIAINNTVYEAYGYTDNSKATSAQVTVKIGETVLSKSGPVVDGFYLVTFPRDPSTTIAWDFANIGTEKVVTYDAAGNEVETWKNPWQIPCPAVQGPCTPATR